MPASNSPTCSRSPASIAWLRNRSDHDRNFQPPETSNDPDGISPPGRFVFGAAATQGNRFRLTGGVSDQRLEVVGIEVGEFSPNLKAVLVFWISHEVHGHVFDDGHVLRPIAAA